MNWEEIGPGNYFYHEAGPWTGPATNLLDLKHEVPRQLKNSSPRLLDILYRLARTIAYAHEIGVVHRDLKPANIIVGKFGEVYVLDWGLAKILGGKTLAKELGESESPRPQPHP